MSKPLYYTFANHMHWVDMQWLWGYDVLPGSVDDMLRLIDETGARGNVNFDGIGYERMAVECPDALARLREAVGDGRVEPVGATYGQPYALFHGGESAIQQFAFGVRATLRQLGVRPTSFWEEEFLFFPQLPQVLAGAGYRCACLFFQWTWHTPELPRERASLIHWEGIDGTRLPTLPRNDLNVHQWPEDFDGLLDGELARTLEHPVVAQWVELMPSRDWMCRAEVLLPRLRELMDDERFDVRPRTLGALVDELQSHTGDVPVRRYALHEVWHGMTLGKNADRHPRRCRAVEAAIRAAEGVATVAGLLARPYPSWDVYPTWELDEAWRELLAAQHHDNHECEGLCGFVGHHQLDRAESAAREVTTRTLGLVGDRTGAPRCVTAGVGWTRRVAVHERDGAEATIEIPPFGWATLDAAEHVAAPPLAIDAGPTTITLRRGDMVVVIDRVRGAITGLGLGEAVPLAVPLPQPTLVHLGVFDRFEAREVAVDGDVVHIDCRAGNGAVLRVAVSLPVDVAGVDLAIAGTPDVPRPDPGLGPALGVEIAPPGFTRLFGDTPYAVDEVRPGGPWRRKYPAADWMTTPQWFEEVRDAFTAHSLLDFVDGAGNGVLVVHDGSQQWFRTARGARVLLHAYDAWDEHRVEPHAGPLRLRLLPHGPLTHAERVQAAHGLAPCPPTAAAGRTDAPRDAPARLGALEVRDAPGVLAMALRRLSAQDGRGLPEWAGHGMPETTHPWLIRLVEWNDAPAEPRLVLPGPVASAVRTNLLGEASGPGAALPVEALGEVDAPAWAPPGSAWCAVRVPMRRREIATILADVVPARKVWRDLDAKRAVWATVHRKAGEST